VQLYAIYLEEAVQPGTLPAYVGQICSAIEEGKKEIERVKIGLEKEQNYSANLENMYMDLLNDRRAKKSKHKLFVEINGLLNANLGFNYEIEGNEIIEGGEGKTDKTFKKCLTDISESFLAGREGTDGLYHMFWERAVEELEKGVRPDNMLEHIKSILGEKLYSL
jgi:hypothetical protein